MITRHFIRTSLVACSSRNRCPDVCTEARECAEERYGPVQGWNVQ